MFWSVAEIYLFLFLWHQWWLLELFFYPQTMQKAAHYFLLIAAGSASIHCFHKRLGYVYIGYLCAKSLAVYQHWILSINVCDKCCILNFFAIFIFSSVLAFEGFCVTVGLRGPFRRWIVSSDILICNDSLSGLLVCLASFDGVLYILDLNKVLSLLHLVC